MSALRRAGVSDAPAIAQLWLESARAGFAELLPADHAWPTPDQAAERTAAAMEDQGATLFVAEGPTGFVGYVGLSPSRDPDAAPGVGEVRTLFVHPSAWRTGLGSRLLRRALDELSAQGYLEATVWSFLANERANAFYEAHGFVRDGARRREAVWHEIDEVRYRTSLAPA